MKTFFYIKILNNFILYCFASIITPHMIFFFLQMKQTRFDRLINLAFRYLASLISLHMHVLLSKWKLGLVNHTVDAKLI